jgi:hypothetical protein
VSLDPISLNRFEFSSRALADAVPIGDKRVVFPAEHFPERMLKSVPLCAILLLRRDAQKAGRISPARKPEVMRTLALSTLGTVVPRPDRAAMDAIGTLVERLPGYWLDLGGDVRETAGLVAGALAGVTSDRSSVDETKPT